MKFNNVDCMLLWKTWNKNPNHIIFTKLQNNPHQSCNFATYLITNNKEVPEIIIQGIAKKSGWSYYFAEYLIDNDKEIPEPILQAIAKEFDWSYNFAKYLIRNNKEVPEIIRKSGIKYKKAQLKENRIVDIFNNILITEAFTLDKSIVKPIMDYYIASYKKLRELNIKRITDKTFPKKEIKLDLKGTKWEFLQYLHPNVNIDLSTDYSAGSYTDYGNTITLSLTDTVRTTIDVIEHELLHYLQTLLLKHISEKYKNKPELLKKLTKDAGASPKQYRDLNYDFNGRLIVFEFKYRGYTIYEKDKRSYPGKHLEINAPTAHLAKKEFLRRLRNGENFFTINYNITEDKINNIQVFKSLGERRNNPRITTR